MKRVVLILMLVAGAAAAQTNIQVTVDPNKAAQVIRIAVPFPETTIPRNAPADATAVDPEAIRTSFFAPLTRDIAYSGIFAIAPQFQARRLLAIPAALKASIFAVDVQEEQKFK